MLEEIVGEAANLLEEMPEYAQVFITSGDMDKLMDMRIELDEYVIDDVKFITPQQILNGYLRGRCGELLIMYGGYLPDDMLHCIEQEGKELKRSYE